MYTTSKNLLLFIIKSLLLLCFSTPLDVVLCWLKGFLSWVCTFGCGMSFTAAYSALILHEILICSLQRRTQHWTTEISGRRHDMRNKNGHALWQTIKTGNFSFCILFLWRMDLDFRETSDSCRSLLSSIPLINFCNNRWSGRKCIVRQEW